MPRFRRRRGGFSRRGTREQLLWFRQVATTSDAAAFGSALQLALFTPSTILAASNLDERYTVRRVKVAVYTRDSFSAAVAQSLQHFAGVYLGNVAEGRSPALRIATDQETDWMSLAMGTLPIGAGAGNVQAGPFQAGIGGAVNGNPTSGFNPWAFDIRAQRKIDMDQELILSVDDLANATDGNPTRSARILTAEVSVLFQRTRR